MLVIRLQRTGRKGHAMFRVVVQDSRRTPSSGKVVARLGSYDPHSKTVVLDKEKAAFYLDHGAQPSDRAVYLLSKEGLTKPKWVKVAAQKQRTVRNADKRRSTRPPEPASEVVTPESEPETPATAPEEEVVTETEETTPEIEASPPEEPKEEKSEDTDEATAENTAEKEPEAEAEAKIEAEPEPKVDKKS
jgi:small subunit ribosomal protein S16